MKLAELGLSKGKCQSSLFFAAYIYVNSGIKSETSATFISQVILTFILFGLEFYVLSKVRRKYYEAFATRQLFDTIHELEKNVSFWCDPDFRNHVAASLERVATSIERIPLRLAGVSNSIRREIFVTSKNKAQAMRQLEIWAIKPGPSTHTDLVGRLTSDLSTMAEGRWYDLPEMHYEKRISKRRVASAIITFIVIIGITVAAISFGSNKLGASLTVVFPALITSIIIFLKYAGVSTSIIEDAVGAGPELTGRQ